MDNFKMHVYHYPLIARKQEFSDVISIEYALYMYISQL